MLLELCDCAGIKYRYVAQTKGGEYHSPCPECGGTDRFIINPNWPSKQCIGIYGCRQCPAHGNSITFAMRYLGYTLTDAKQLVGAVNEPHQVVRRSHEPTITPLTTPSALWLKQAGALATYLDTIPDHIRTYLHNRGITDYAIDKQQIGYNPETFYLDRKLFRLPSESRKNVWIPEGIVIPYWHNNQVTRIKFRRTGDITDQYGKYIILTGSQNGMSVYSPGCKAAIVVESEFDAIALDAIAKGKITVIASGSNIRNPDTYTHEVASGCSLIAIAYDNDKEGKKMLYKWRSFFPLAIKYPTPVGKDVGEAIQSGYDVAGWLQKLYL